MAGHIQDRWYRTEPGPDGKPIKVKTDRHGVGLRYRARYIAPDGSEKSKSFPDRKKRDADQWLAHIEADMSRGQYIDPQAGKITFRQYATDWLASRTWGTGRWPRSSPRTSGHGPASWRTPGPLAPTGE